MSLLIAIGIMALVVVPLISWAFWADRRQRQGDDSPSARKEEVA
jgi:hypothetical protein